MNQHNVVHSVNSVNTLTCLVLLENQELKVWSDRSSLNSKRDFCFLAFSRNHLSSTQTIKVQITDMCKSQQDAVMFVAGTGRSSRGICILAERCRSRRRPFGWTFKIKVINSLAQNTYTVCCATGRGCGRIWYCERSSMWCTADLPPAEYQIKM